MEILKTPLKEQYTANMLENTESRGEVDTNGDFVLKT